VTEPADADHDRRRVRRQPRPAALHRVQRGHAGVRQRRGRDRIDGAQRHQVSRRHDDELRHAAVARDARNLGRQLATEIILAAPTGAARAAADELVHRDLRAQRLTANRRSHPDDLTHDLVPERHRKRRRARAQETQIGAAHPGGEHPQQRLVATGRRRLDVDDLGVTGAAQTVRPHRQRTPCRCSATAGAPVTRAPPASTALAACSPNTSAAARPPA
jgi:hypothetical protein